MKRLVHVQTIFDRFSKGKLQDRVMNLRGFQRFCEEVGMVNPGARPFLTSLAQDSIPI